MSLAHGTGTCPSLTAQWSSESSWCGLRAEAAQSLEWEQRNHAILWNGWGKVHEDFSPDTSQAQTVLGTFSIYWITNSKGLFMVPSETQVFPLLDERALNLGYLSGVCCPLPSPGPCWLLRQTTIRSVTTLFLIVLLFMILTFTSVSSYLSAVSLASWSQRSWERRC